MKTAKNRQPVPVSRWLVYAILALSSLLILMQLVFQRYFVAYVGNIYQSNLNLAVEQIVAKVQDTFTSMNRVVEYIALNPEIQEYASTANTEQRYIKAFNSARPVVIGAIQNLQFDHVMIADITGDWYHFSTILSSMAGQQLKQELEKGREAGWSTGTLNTVVSLDGVPYFCTAKPIMVIQNATHQQVGLVVALTDISKMRKMLQDFDRLWGLSIELHNFTQVLVSNQPEADGLPLHSAALLDTMPMYRRSETILPGSLGLDISIPKAMIFPQQASLVMIFLGVGAFSVVLVLLAAFFINRLVARPVTQLIDETRALGDISLGNRLTPTGVRHIDELVQSINGMLGRLQEYNAREIAAQQHLHQMELRHYEAQLYLLNNQIDRHFLYNSLVSIKTLADRGESDKVEQVAGGIAMLLRYATSPAQEVNLFREFDVVQRYVNIQNIRFGGKISFDFDIDDRLCDYKALKLLVQPLVENALIHGLEKKREGCRLQLRGYLHENTIHIEVEDNGAGIAADKLQRMVQNIKAGEHINLHRGLDGIALINIQQRIRIAYGTPYGLTLKSEEGHGTLAAITLPALPDTSLR